MRTALRKKGYPGEDFSTLPAPEIAAAKLVGLLSNPQRP
jgi:hypothetical protein